MQLVELRLKLQKSVALFLVEVFDRDQVRTAVEGSTGRKEPCVRVQSGLRRRLRILDVLPRAERGGRNLPLFTQRSGQLHLRETCVGQLSLAEVPQPLSEAHRRISVN